jgi:hypothetical protein
MPAGTWNLGRLRKQTPLLDLNNYPTIQIRDNSLISSNYFGIVEFPSRLTSGKNLIKLRANNENLVIDAQIHVEVLDANGSPIYNEPLNYLEKDGTRVISIYIYEETPPGNATIFLASRAAVDVENGRRALPFSRELTDDNYFNLPNVIWSRTTVVSPDQKNSTEIIHVTKPSATIKEIVSPYLETKNLRNVATARSASGASVILTPIGGNDIRPTPALTDVAGQPVSPALQGAGRQGSPGRYGTGGQQQTVAPRIDLVDDRNEPVLVSSSPINTVSSFSLLTTTGFPLSASMENGTITIVNPNIEVHNGTFINAAGQAVPASQFSNQPGSEIVGATTSTGTIQLSGSYRFGVAKVLSDTRAKVYQIDGFKNINDDTISAFNVNLISTETLGAALVGAALGGASSGQGTYPVNRIESSTNFTASFTLPFLLQESPKVQSFAEIVLANIEPNTGDVYKIKTLYKPAGQMGNFIDTGDIVVEQTELLEDSNAFEAETSIGARFNRMGVFTSLTDFTTYFTTNIESVYDTGGADVMVMGGVEFVFVSSSTDTSALNALTYDPPRRYVPQNFPPDYESFTTFEQYAPRLENTNELVTAINAMSDQMTHEIVAETRNQFYATGTSTPQLIDVNESGTGDIYGPLLILSASNNGTSANLFDIKTGSLDGQDNFQEHGTTGIKTFEPLRRSLGVTDLAMLFERQSQGFGLFGGLASAPATGSIFLNRAASGSTAVNTTNTAEVTLSPVYNVSDIMSAVRFVANNTFNATTQRFASIFLRKQHRPEIIKNTDYILTFDAHANANTANSSDPLIPLPRIDVYARGEIDSGFLSTPNTVILNPVDIDGNDAYKYAKTPSTINNIDASLTDGALISGATSTDLSDGGTFGQRIATIEFSNDESMTDINIRFSAIETCNLGLIFVIRRGQWSLANISVRTLQETGFTPNYLRLNTLIPSQYINTPLTFQFKYYDFQGNEADTVTEVYPVKFLGNNTVVYGDTNLITGSMYVGNTVGEGVEMSGETSAFIRSIGYFGYSASLAGSRPEAKGGFLFYSGSILKEELNFFGGNAYQGVGLELVDDTDTGHLIFHTDPSILDIKAQDFFIGDSTSAFICGSSATSPANIAISSSNFFLGADGEVTIGAGANIFGALSAQEVFVPFETNKSNAAAYISASGEAAFIGDQAGNYQVLVDEENKFVIKQSPTGRELFNASHSRMDGLNQGRIIQGPMLHSLTPVEAFYAGGSVSTNEFEAFTVDYDSPSGVTATLNNFGDNSAGIDWQTQVNTVIPEFRMNDEDEYIVIMYRAGAFTSYGGYFNNSTRQFDDSYRINNNNIDTTYLQSEGGFFGFNDGFDFDDMVEIMTGDDLSDTTGTDDSAGLSTQAFLPRFDLYVEQDITAAAITKPASSVYNISNITVEGQDAIDYSPGGSAQYAGTDAYHFCPRSSAGSWPIIFSTEMDGVREDSNNRGKNFLPCHNPGIIVIQHGSCDMYGQYVNLKGKSLRMEVTAKRYFPEDVYDFDSPSLNYAYAPYFIKDINIIVGNRVQVQALVDQYTTSDATGTGFTGNNFALLANGTNNNMLELDPAIITNYTGSAAINNNSGFTVYTGGPYNGGGLQFAVDMDCEEEEEG